MQMSFTTDIWERCYTKGWTGVLTPASFAHPAKVSFGLAERVYQHIREEGWAGPGSTVIDPFGGIGGFAFHALHAGLNFVGVELESKFVALANENLAEWQHKYGHREGWGSARIIQGDSRRLAEVIREAGLSVSSPPYARALGNAAGYSDEAKALADADRGIMVNGGKAADLRYSPDPANLGNLPASSAGFSAAVSSPPFGDANQTDRRGLSHPLQQGKFHGPRSWGKATQYEHVAADGNLQNLQANDAGLAIALSSPPYVESLSSDDLEKRGGLFRDPKRKNDKTLTATYGESAGQLGAMKEGAFDVAVSSPPWEKGAEGMVRKEKFRDPAAFAAEMSARGGNGNNHSASIGARKAQLERDSQKTYGDSAGQLGTSAGDDFWSAAKQIIEQTYLVLAPGAHAIWVLKGFVRKGKYVDFPDQWRQLCESVGFETIHWHNASLIEHSGVQARFDGEEDQIEVQRKSFFRRLSEAKGSPRIDSEVVLCTRKLL